MNVVVRMGNTMPKSCDECKLLVRCEGYIHCAVGGEYTSKEIESEKDGVVKIYDRGYLDNRPNNCPLEELKESEPD